MGKLKVHLGYVLEESDWGMLHGNPEVSAEQGRKNDRILGISGSDLCV